MMVSVETYLRRGQRTLKRWVLDPRVRTLGVVLGYGGSGFLLSGASLGGAAMPLAMGLVCGATGWRALLLGLGAMVGYPAFWGPAGSQGVVWSAAALLLALMVGSREESRHMPLMLPVLGSFFTAVTGLIFQVFLKEDVKPELYFLRIALAGLSAVLFTQVLSCRDVIADWMAQGVGVLALAQVSPLPGLGLGYLAAGVLGVSGAFPAAALAGLGLDLAQVTKVPMTAVLCVAYFLGMIPFGRRWQHYAAPGFACLAVMAVSGIWDTSPLPGLFLGGALGALAPRRPQTGRRRGETGVAQVRLELGAEVMAATAGLLLEEELPPIDREAILEKVRWRACGNCSARRTCLDQGKLTPELLDNPLDADCRKAGRLIPELRRAQDQLRLMQADRQRRLEYRAALMQQYRFLAAYLRGLSDRLPRRGESSELSFRIEVSARSRGKDRANGDRCIAFSGAAATYFVLLCDGMGTGLGAAQEGQTAAGLLRQMLCAGFPPEHALGSLNSLLTLEGRGGAVTVDLAEVSLDTGLARIFKWGAAPSWCLTRRGAEKIGTATPPPGLSVSDCHETVEKLSLRRGEVLILLSDGVDGEGALRLSDLTPDAPPGELAAEILEKGRGAGEDDATVAVLRLRPIGPGPS
ncbi:MAG: PP2C family protein-serine/threonine phosphatase [Eubacteriales bacterium]|nr:PP2C family protein-serine/threonine phosphatase [Eubacteriales bacterium]